jgi:hypothetical protein
MEPIGGTKNSFFAQVWGGFVGSLFYFAVV